jgi:hypothetical protein
MEQDEDKNNKAILMEGSNLTVSDGYLFNGFGLLPRDRCQAKSLQVY